MEKERKIKVLSLIALIVAVLGLTVAFSIFSATLKINGTAGIDLAEMNIHFEKFSNVGKDCSTGNEISYCDSSETFVVSQTNDGKINTLPTIGEDNLSLNGFDVTLTKPGDMVMFVVPVVNEGKVDATLSDILINGISMSEYLNASENATEILMQGLRSLFPEADWDGDGETTDEERMTAAENILFEFHWADFTDKPTISLDEIVILDIGATFKAGGIAGAIIQVRFSSDDNASIPKGKVKMNMDYKYVFSQS